jgi:hypothetical protein
MVTSQLYKSYSTQIAKLFCVNDPNKVLCEASLINRLNTYLDDYTYPYFLAKLNSGRQYITNLEQFQNKGFRIVLTDLITGDRVTAWWEVPYNMPYYGILPGKLLSHQYNIISANKTFNAENKSDIRITHNPVKATYGITFVPSQVPGYNPPQNNPPGNDPPGIKIIPNQTPATEPTKTGLNFDFGEILSNPILLIGGGIALYLLLKDKF